MISRNRFLCGLLAWCLTPVLLYAEPFAIEIESSDNLAAWEQVPIEEFDLLPGGFLRIDSATDKEFFRLRLHPDSGIFRQHTLLGYGISPPGFPATFERMDVYLDDVLRLRSPVVMWNGSWRAEEPEPGESNDCGEVDPQLGDVPCAPRTVETASLSHGFAAVHVFGWRAETVLLLETAGSSQNNWSNQEAASLYVQVVRDFAAEYHPRYLFLGNESDHYYYMDAADYENWIAVYNDAYDAIKEVSQNTKVGPVFHYEHLSGNGILNAPDNDPENRWVTEYWEAIDLHDLSRVDIVGITLYPWLNHENPHDIPGDYLQPLLQRLGDSIPIAITETAWPAENLSGQEMPWATTPDAQLGYVEQLAQFLPSDRVEFILWPFLYQPVQSPEIPDEVRAFFGGTAFHDGNNLPLPAYPVWRNLQLD